MAQQKNRPHGRIFGRLLFYLFVNRVLSAPFAEFIELNFTLNKLFVLARPIVDVFAGFAAEFDKLIL